MKETPPSWETDRLLMQDCHLVQAGNLLDILTSSSWVESWHPALRFWLRAGFTQIVEYRGDPACADDTHAVLILEKVL